MLDKLAQDIRNGNNTAPVQIEVANGQATTGSGSIPKEIRGRVEGLGSKASRIFEAVGFGNEARKLSTAALGVATGRVSGKALSAQQVNSLYSRMLDAFVKQTPDGRAILNDIHKELSDLGYKITRSGPTAGIEFVQAMIEVEVAYQKFLNSGRDVRFSRQLTPEQEDAIGHGFGRPDRQTFREQIDQARDNIGNKFLQGVVDQFRPIKDLSEKAWQMARMTKSSPGAMAAAFLHGQVFLDNNGAIDLNTERKGLAEILKPLGDELDFFFQWIAGNRAEQLSLEDRENLFTEEQIEALKSLNQGTMADGRSREQVYNEIFREFNQFKKSVLDVARKSGLLNAEETEHWDNDFYVPFYRVLEETGEARGPNTSAGLVKQRAFKKLKGGTQQLNDLLTNTLMNFDHLIGSSLKNQAALEAMQAAVEVGAAVQIPAAQAVKNDKAVYVKIDGRDVHFEIQDETILTAISALNYAGMNNAGMKVLRKMKRVFTYGVTSSPEFRIANLIRDTIQAVGVSDISANGFKNLKDGVKAMKKDSELRKRLLAAGGTMEFGYQFGNDPDAARAMIRRMERQAAIDTGGNATQLFKDGVRRMWNWWQETGNTAENVNRAAIYKQGIENGKTHFEAAFEAADMLDFRQAGAWPAVRFLVQAVPFLNARIQGLDKLGRSATDERQRKRFAATVAAYSMAAIALYLAAKDDDDWKDQEDWLKDNYLWFKLPGTDTAMTIPVPFEIGAIGTMAWRGVERELPRGLHRRSHRPGCGCRWSPRRGDERQR